MSLADTLERAADALPELADAIRPANGDPERLLERLDAEQTRRVLAWLLAEAPDDAEPLAAEWSEHPEGREALAAMDEGALGKSGRKVLRRVRHRLRSRGEPLPDTPPAPRVARLPEVEDAVGGAFLSPIDPSGSRAVVLVEPHPSGGARIFELLTDEVRGIRRCEVFKASRGQARRFLRDATEGEKRAGVPVEVAAARAYVARVAARQPADRAFPRTFAEWRSHVAQAPEGTPTPGEQAAAELGEPEAADRDRALELVTTGVVGPWPPPESALRPAAEKIAEARASRLVVSGASRRERFEEILREAAEACFSEGFFEVTAARFAESAYVFWKMGEEGMARACLAGARAFREEPPEGNPLARAMLERLLAPLLGGESQEDERTSDAEDSPLLVKP